MQKCEAILSRHQHAHLDPRLLAREVGIGQRLARFAFADCVQDLVEVQLPGDQLQHSLATPEHTPRVRLALSYNSAHSILLKKSGSATGRGRGGRPLQQPSSSSR